MRVRLLSPGAASQAQGFCDADSSKPALQCNLKEQQPCSSCVARGCPTVCPNGVLANMSGKRLVLAECVFSTRYLT
jgi:hypothetical protein